jgi:PBP1b-binding outer membrane lipoprotein LpoB
MMKSITLILASAFLLSACATVKLTEGGEKIRVLDPNEVTSCRNLGRTSASVTAKVIIDRPADSVAEELQTVARNSAARMGGDTIVPLTVIENGAQTFVVYKCVNPDG